jgi:hypothetical protein
MGNQARAIIWAQWRTTRNHFPRSNKAALAVNALLTVIWYGGFAFLGGLAAFLLSNPEELTFIHDVLPTALLVCFLYWQLIPVLMASMGSSLDTKKLLVYPIPTGQLFALEVLLRISTGVEMLLLVIGAGIGLLLNPKIPFWGPSVLLVFVVLNLFCSASPGAIAGAQARAGNGGASAGAIGSAAAVAGIRGFPEPRKVDIQREPGPILAVDRDRPTGAGRSILGKSRHPAGLDCGGLLLRAMAIRAQPGRRPFRPGRYRHRAQG